MKLLSEEFLAQYPDQPEHMNELGQFVMYRTYSRWLESKGRRETWKEIAQRSVEYNVGISLKEFDRNRFTAPIDKIELEAQALFDNIFNLRQFLSGRTHWVGGADTNVADKFPLANFNCSFINIRSWEDLGDLFYLLLVGTGVGFKCTKEFARELPPVKGDFTLLHSEYKPLPKSQRLEDTLLHIMENGFAKIYVGDSKEGWVEALRTYLRVLTEEQYADIHTIKISYNSIRPKGERLKTFGGTASGYEPLKEMFEGFKGVIQNKLDPSLEPLEDAGYGYVKVRPIHILDMGNLVGNNVVVGGVRRTAEIFLMDDDDWECILAKYGINGIWNEEHHTKVLQAIREERGYVPNWLLDLPTMDANARPLHHRRMSNNSIAFETKPSEEMLKLVFLIMQGEGEPGFINLEEARRRRPNAEGLNPCAEILLDSYGVCNLTTVNADAFVIWSDEENKYTLDYAGIMHAQALSARAGVRMTCLDLELPHWDKVQKRDRLIGTSLTGWKDAMGKLGYDHEQEMQLLNLLQDSVRFEAMKYANILRIPIPLLDTTVKPEGTLSQVAGGVSSGLHVSNSPYYFRRIRINANDPLAQVVKDLGWTIHAEVGTAGLGDMESLAKPEIIEQARTLVITFPVKSGATKTKADQTVKEQFDTYFGFQDHYTAHNSSNTISVKPDEWDEARQIVWDGWDSFVGVSFLAEDGGSYMLAPYEECTEEEYEELKKSMKEFDSSLLATYEKPEEEFDAGDADCATGACPIR